MTEKYIKRPVEVETLKWNGKNMKQIIEFAGDYKVWESTDNTLLIETLEGNMTASKGDYIIKGVDGEIYPCKPDIFHKTYQANSEVEEGTKHDAFNLKFKEHEVFADKLVIVDEDDIPFLWIDKESKKVSFGGRYFEIYKEQQLVAEMGNLREAMFEIYSMRYGHASDAKFKEIMDIAKEVLGDVE